MSDMDQMLAQFAASNPAQAGAAPPPGAAPADVSPDDILQKYAQSAPSPAPMQGAAQNTLWSDISHAGARILNYAGAGASDAWGASPLGLDADTEAGLRRANIINEYKDDHGSFMEAISQAFTRPTVALKGLNAAIIGAGAALLRAPQVALAAGGAGLTQTGAEIEGEGGPGAQGEPGIVQKAVGSAFKGVGELSYGASEGLLGPEFGEYAPAETGALAGLRVAAQANLVDAVARARSFGVIGEGEAGFYDAVPLTPENAEARASAAQDAGLEPPALNPPELGVPAEDGPTIQGPPADIHALARRIDPDTFEQYDALALDRENHRATIAALGEERANSPEALAAQNQIDTIMGKVNGVEARLTNAARDRLAAAQDALTTALTDDTPEMRQARASFLDADFAMRDLAPDVSAAYRQAREMAPDLPENAAQAAAEGEKPGEEQLQTEETAAKGDVEAGAEPGQPQLTPENEAGIRAAPAAEEAAIEAKTADVVGKETPGTKENAPGNAPGQSERPGNAPETPRVIGAVGGAERAAPLPESPGPSPGLTAATNDVIEARSKRPANSNIMQAIKKLGGLKVRNEDGSLTGGPDVQGALDRSGKKIPGLINNATGLSPERMHEALAEQGWFGHGDIHPEALVQAIEKQARGEDVYHPESGLAEAHARRHALDEEMNKAGITRKDDATTAARKLSHYREVEQNTAAAMETLRARADQLGVPHDAASTYDGLLGDIIEREAIQGDATEHGADTYERDIDTGLTADEFERLHAEAERQLGPSEGIGDHGPGNTGAEAAGAGESASGTGGGGDGAAEAGGGGPRGDFGVVGTGDVRTRGVSATTEARALENGLTEAFGDLPEYNQMSKADQAARVVAVMDRDWEMAKAIAMGDAPPPRGVLPESFFEGVRMRAIASGDWETARALATQSKLVSEATTMGRRIGMYAARDPTDPVAAIKDVAQAREAAAGPGLDAAKAREVAAAREEVAKQPVTSDMAQSLIDIIRC